MKETKLEINKKMIGKPVKVLEQENDWVGYVVSVEDECTFKVSDGEKVAIVDIFDIRSID
jgi:hypothetical protein